MSTAELKVDNAELFPFIISLLEKGHTATLRLRGFSMRPFLEDNRDVALLAALDGCPSIGAPVLAEVTPGRWVLHRLIDVEGEAVTLLGDGNLTPEHCRICDLRAQVVGFYRKGSSTLTPVASRRWTIYSWWWMRLRPIRRYLLGIDRRINRLIGR